MPLPTLPSKLVWERIRVEFNFASELLLNETITAWEVTVAVQTGDDPTPENMLATRRFLDVTSAYQWIIQGLPGVVYRLTGTATGSTGKTYKLERTLAVLPCEQISPPLFGVTYTTTPYPIESIESLDIVALVSSGKLDTPPRITESMDLVAFALSGSLNTPVVYYSMQPEALDLSALIQSGTLRSPLIQYSMQPESMDLLAVMLNGSLKVTLISYVNYIPEAFDLSCELTGGSLT